MLLEDAVDLADFFEMTGRTILRTKWATEAVVASARVRNSSVF